MAEPTKPTKTKLLLHICCAGCGIYVSKLLKMDYDISLYFFNPNIFPDTEYKIREEEVKKIATEHDLKLIIENSDHKDWLQFIKGHEQAPEKGERCYLCYQYRLEKLARQADALKFDSFSTTLSVSPHKVYKYIKEIGDELAKKYSLDFLDQDFKKKDGYLLSTKMSKELGLYRQNYCGCEFSIRK